MKVSIILSIIFVSVLLLTGCGCSNSEKNKAQTVPSTTEVATTEPTTEKEKKNAEKMSPEQALRLLNDKLEAENSDAKATQRL